MASRRNESGDFESAKQMELKKKRKKDSTSSDSQEDYFGVGMVAITRKDGVFKDPHEIGRFVADRIGRIKSVRVSRSGMVIIECASENQMYKAMDIEKFGESCRVKCFPLEGRERSVGVINVPLSFPVEEFLDLCYIREVKRLSRIRDGKKEDTTSVCVVFARELPEKVILDYVVYRVRPFEKGPLRCFACQEYGHVASVCRKERKCASCGNSDCVEEECREMGKEPVCIHCNGNHRVGSVDCPRRQLEKNINTLRRVNKLSYADALKRTKSDEAAKEQKKDHTFQENYFTVDKRHFLAFIAMIINCATSLQGKSERINMVLDAAKRFLNVGDITGEDLDVTLREGFSKDNNGQ